jgi:hypothetical protein
MTTTSPIGATFVKAAEMLAAHLDDHALPEAALLDVMTEAGRSTVSAQVQPHTMADIAAELLIWAQTLSTFAIQLRRVPDGDRVHLSIASILTGPAGEVGPTVYGGCSHDPTLIADIAPGGKRTISLDELRAWAPGGGEA